MKERTNTPANDQHTLNYDSAPEPAKAQTESASLQHQSSSSDEGSRDPEYLPGDELPSLILLGLVSQLRERGTHLEDGQAPEVSNDPESAPDP